MTGETDTTTVFEDFAADAVAHFPQLKGRLLIAEVVAEGALVMHGNIDPEKTGFDKGGAADYARAESIFLRHALSKNDAKLHMDGFAHIDREKDIYLICANRLVDAAARGALSEEKERKVIRVLDHELGHLVVKDGYFHEVPTQTVNLGEAAATAYALVRHFQRYGKNDTDPLLHPALNAFDLLRGDVAHFAAFVTEAIIDRRHMIDFHTMTPEQTTLMAWRFAVEYSLPLPVMERLKETFSPVMAGDYVSIDIALKITLAAETDIHTFKFGSLILKWMLNEGGPEREDREKILSALKEREFQFAEEEILVRAPVIDGKPKFLGPRASPPKKGPLR